MNKKIILFHGAGVGLFGLRLWENTQDFDSTTGLHTLSPAGIALIVLILASAAAALVFSLQEKKEKDDFASHFTVPEKSVVLLLVLGSLLMAAGGVLLAADAFASGVLSGGEGFSASAAASLATAVLAVLSCIGLLVLTRSMRRGETPSLVTLLPPMFFAAFWVLSLYLPAASDPVLPRYAFPILAAALAAYTFAQLAGFFRRETRTGVFCFVACWATALCMGAAAELNGHSALYLGCALLFPAFLLLQKNGKSDRCSK